MPWCPQASTRTAATCKTWLSHYLLKWVPYEPFSFKLPARYAVWNLLMHLPTDERLLKALKARMQQIEQSIDRYLTAMDSADRAAPEVAEAKTERLPVTLTS